MSGFPHTQALRCFIAVARTGNVSRAAEALHLSQPAVSLQLKSLGESTGLVLFNRVPGGLELTPAGATLLPDAEKVIAALSCFNDAVASLKSILRETLKIGTILEPEFIQLGALLKGLIDGSPQLVTELHHGMSDDILEQVRHHQLDVGFYLDLPPAADPAPTPAPWASQDLDMRPLMRFTYRIVAPPGWEARVLGQDWQGLAGQPWLATPVASAHRRLLSSVFQPLGVEPRRVGHTDQEESMLDMVASGLGLSLARDAIAVRESQARGLVIADRVALDCVLSFVSLKSRSGEPTIAKAWAAIGQVWPQTARPGL